MSSIENKGKVIYLDNAATTKMSEEVKEAMDPYLEEKFGNASTMYGYGETSRLLTNFQQVCTKMIY